MIIYNVTVKVQQTIKTQWLHWLKKDYIPGVLQTGCFTDARILLLLEVDDSEGPTYAIQFYAESKALYNLYIEKFAGLVRQKSLDQWGDQFIAFHTLLLVVD